MHVHPFFVFAERVTHLQQTALLLHAGLIRAVLVFNKQCYGIVSDHWGNRQTTGLALMKHSHIFHYCFQQGSSCLYPPRAHRSVYMFHANLWHFSNAFILSFLQRNILYCERPVVCHITSTSKVSGRMGFIFIISIPAVSGCWSFKVFSFFKNFCHLSSSGWRLKWWEIIQMVDAQLPSTWKDPRRETVCVSQWSYYNSGSGTRPCHSATLTNSISCADLCRWRPFHSSPRPQSSTEHDRYPFSNLLENTKIYFYAIQCWELTEKTN